MLPSAASAVCASTPAPSSGLFFHGSTNGESNQPGATTFTVMPAGARSSARPFARPTRPAFDALYAASPSRGRSPRTEPVKISRPPSPITRAAARAPRNAPVRLTSRISRQTAGSVLRGPATIGEIPALQIHTSTPPHSATVASATASLKSSSVTSPGSTSDGPGKLVGDRLEVGLGPRHQRDPRAALRERAREQAAEAPAGAGDHHTLPGHVTARAKDTGMSIGWTSRSLFVPVSTIHGSCSATPTSSRCTDGCS